METPRGSRVEACKITNTAVNVRFLFLDAKCRRLPLRPGGCEPDVTLCGSKEAKLTVCYPKIVCWNRLEAFDHRSQFVGLGKFGENAYSEKL